MANEVRIPIKLEVLQNSIGDLQKILNNLQPNTAGFKTIERIIHSMVQESQKLQAQLTKPFNSDAQFRTTNKTIDKLEESAARISVIMNGLKFSDLKLTPEQQGAFDALNNKINEIKSNYQSLSNEVKAGLLKSDDNTSLIAGLPNANMLEANFADIKAAVDKHVADLEASAERERAAYQQMRSNAELASRANVLTSTGAEGGITHKTVGKAIFDKFLYQNQYGIGFQKAFNNKEGTSAFLQALEQEFKLEPGALKDLIGKSFDEINAAIQEYGKSGKNPFQGLMSAYGSTSYNKKIFLDKEQLNQLETSLTQYKQLQNELNTLQQSKIGPADTAAQEKIAGLNAEIERLGNSILKTAGVGGSLQQPLNQISSQAQYLRTTLQQCNTQFLQMQRTTQSFNQMKMAVVNFMGFYQVLNLTKRAVREAMNHIKELDSVMNKISIVTDMSTGDLWNQVDAYSKMAQSYGVSIKGAYEVSQIYYQQGLDTKDVLTLTNETLKLAKVSGLDYAQTTDYMTTALRGFKMEMSEASTVVDVYSNLAAHTAVSSEELAVAMSKTASSMESVGSTFEESSAMIATMVAVTRESATNIGSALKSIAARYGEMKKDPSTLVDSEGETLAYNKVDAALQSVGISMKTTDGQFREFTDVIIELSEKWNDLDSVQQRYIATQFAGNRQQSRFLALVSNKDLLKSNLDYAENAEDTGTLQALKSLDSIESKLNQVQVAYQQFYTTLGAENVWKGLLDGATNVINTLNNLPKLFDKIPLSAITVVANIIGLLKSLAFKGLSELAQNAGQSFSAGLLSTTGEAATAGKGLINAVVQAVTEGKSALEAAGKTGGQAYANGLTSGVKHNQLKPNQLTGDKKIQYEQNAATINALTKYDKLHTTDGVAANMAMFAQKEGLISTQQYEAIINSRDGAASAVERLVAALSKEQEQLLNSGNVAEQSAGRFAAFAASHKNLGNSLTNLGYALNMVSVLFNTTTSGGRAASSVFMMAAGAVQLFGSAIKYANDASKTIPWMAIASGVMALINGISMAIVTPEERIQELEKIAEDTSNKAKEIKANTSTLENGIKKLDELKEKRYESTEAAEEYQTAVDDLASKFPGLVSSFDEAGNAILNEVNLTETLADARQKSADAAYNAAQAELKLQEERLKQDLKNGKLEGINPKNNFKEEIGQYLIEQTGSNKKLKWISQLYTGADTGINYYDLMQYGNADDNLLNALQSIISAKELHENTNYSMFYEQIPVLQSIINILAGLEDDFSLTDVLAALQVEIKNGTFNEFGEQGLEYVQSFISLLTTVTGAFSSVDESEQSYIEKTAEEINTAIDDYNAAIESENLVDIKDKFKILQDTLNKYKDNPWVAAYIQANEDEFTTLSSKVSNIITDAATVETSRKDNINSWFRKQFGNSDFITGKSGLLSIFTERLASEAKDIKNLETWLNTGEGYTRAKTLVDNAETFWEDLGNHGEERQNIFVDMIKNINKYRASDFQQFNDIDGWYDRLDQEIYASIQQRAIDIRKNLFDFSEADSSKNWLNWSSQQRESFSKWRTVSQQAQTLQESEYLKNIYSYTDNLYNLGFSSDASEYMNLSLKYFDSLIHMPVDTRNAIYNKIQEYGLNTEEGIQQFLDYIENTDLENDDFGQEYLQLLLDKIHNNLSLSIQAYTSNLVDGWSDKSKQLKQLTSGIDLKEVDNFINSAQEIGMTLSVSDFVTNGDKLVLPSSLAQDYWNKFFESQRTQVQKWEEKFQEATGLLGTVNEDNEFILTNTTLNESTVKALQDLGVNIENYLSFTEGEGYTYKTGQSFQTLSAAAQEAYSNTDLLVAKLLAYIEWQANEVDNANKLLLGDYSDYSSDINELKKLASGETKIKKENYLARNYKEKINSVYDNLISDILSKGFDNINLEDYEGLIQSDKANLDSIIQSKNYVKFIQEYAKLAGKSVDETNDLILQAIEKTNETKAEDLIKDLDFVNNETFYANLEALGDIANAFDKPIESLIQAGAVGYNKITKQYEMHVSKLQNLGIDLHTIDNFETTVQEAIDALFKSITSDISNALKGSLDVKGQQTLVNNLAKLGINLDLEFTKTVEGLKLSETSAISLYTELKRIDALQAQLTFNNLSDSLKESNEHYQSVSSILTRIAELNELIKNADNTTSNARIQQYEEELALAKEILEVRSTSEDDSFNFMSNKIPGGQNNPINYFNNWAKAIHTFNDAIKNKGRGKYKRGGKTYESGFVDYQDWYNLVTEMNNVAALGGEIEFAGMKLDGSLEAASALIQKGAESLVATSTGEIKVALSGMAIDFESGADAFSGGVTEGIQALAQSQVEMLDGMIQLLETIVATEKLGDIDVESNELDFNDLFKVTGWDEEKAIRDFTQFSEGYKNYRDYILTHIDKENYPKQFNKDLADGINKTKFKVGEQEFLFSDLLKMEPTELHQYAQGELGDAYASVLAAYRKAALSGDYSTDNIMASIKEVLGGTGFEGEITIGDLKLTVHSGAVITTDKDGNYVIDGVNYGKNLDAATKGFYTQHMDVLSEALSSSTDTETGITTYTLEGNGQVIVDYSLKDNQYTATIGTTTVTAGSKAGIEFAIATMAQLEDQSLKASKTVTFTIQQEGKGEVQVTVDITNPEDPQVQFSNSKDIAEGMEEIIKQKALELYGDGEKTQVETEKTTEMTVSADLQVKPQHVVVQMDEGITAIPLTAPLTIAPQQIIAKIEGKIPEFEGVLKQSTYDTLEAVITTVKAIYSGEPNSEGISLKDFTYSDFITAILTSLTLKVSENPEITDKEITIGNTTVSVIDTIQALLTHLDLVNQGAKIDNNIITLSNDEQVQIGDLVTALLTQIEFSAENTEVLNETITLPDNTTISVADLITAYITSIDNFDASNAEIADKTIVLPNGNELSAENVIAIVSSLLLNWAEGGSQEPDVSELGLPDSFEAPNTYDYIVKLQTKYELTDDEQFLKDFDNQLSTGRLSRSGSERELVSSAIGITVSDFYDEAKKMQHYEYAQIVDADQFKQTQRYIDLLKTNVVTNGGILDKNTYKNLEEVKALLINTDDTNLQALKSTIDEIITASNVNTENLDNTLQSLSEISPTNLESIASAIERIANAAQLLNGIAWSVISEGLNSLSIENNTNNNNNGNTGGNTDKKTFNFDFSSLFEGISAQPIQNIADVLNNLKFDSSGLETAANALNSIKPTKAGLAAQSLNSISAAPALAAKNALNNISVQSQHMTADAIVTIHIAQGQATGNIGAFAKGNVALAGGTRTLVGELGPELVVSHGRYYLVGQTGAEFVDLDKDAIVFNHKQTERLMKQGDIGSRGQPFTNEQNAISYAKGNVTGPAKADSEGSGGINWTYTYQLIPGGEGGSTNGHVWTAPAVLFDMPAAAKGTGPAQASASAALAALKQLRAQWQALAGLSAQDLAGKGGGGGGGGGGNKNFLKDLERWYDWLQQIAQLEKEITLEEAKRSKYQNDMIAHGKEYFTSQMASLNKLQQQVVTQQSLNESQEAYFEQRRKELNEQSAFSALYGFSETGQLYYKDVYADNKSAFEWLSDLAGRDETTGKANYTAQEQYEKLVAAGFEFAMQYDSSGNEIKKEGDAWYTTAVQAFWDKIDADKEEMQSLHDSVEDGKKEVIDRQNDQNEILHDIEDNQLEVEGKVLKAVEESRQRAIDDAKDERDAIEKSANNLIDGLNQQLENERTLYQNQQSADELATLQRRLAILQRSGGSVSEIADLRSQIEEKQYDKYFDTQEAQIQAIQDASDAELERLDNQITLMEETLAYEKEYGLLWNDVNQVLKGSSEDIVSFIQGNTAEYWAKSSAELSKCLREDIFEVDRFKSFQTSVENGLESLVKMYGGNTDTVEEAQQEEVPKAAEDNGSKYTENAAGQWIQGDNGRWWYKHNDEEGSYTKNDWEKINDKWYHFDEEGWMQTGWFKDKDGQWYYLDDTKGANEGAMLSNTTRALTWDGKVQNHTFDENGVWTGASDINNTSKKKTTWEFDGTKWVEYALNKDGEKGDATGGYSYSDPTAKKKKKAAGGYVNHGLYELGELGTETVLTASQTKVLRDNILSNRPDSLVNLLKSYNEAYHGLSQNAYDSISNTTANMVNIERAEVNLQIEKLADDYDSKRAANTIMDEMLRIASKTKANNSVRR